MSNASALFRSLLVYGLCLPLAVFLGYLLANPMDFATVTVVVVIFFVLTIPLLLRWHHAWLIATWNTTAMLFFVPGKPAVWMGLAVASFTICILQYALNRRMKFLHAPSVAWPLLFLTAVVLLTARLTGGLGARVLGGDTYGGKRYFVILAAVLGYFAIINRRIPPKRAGLYVTLFFAGAATMAIANLPGVVSPSLNFLFVFFPVASMDAFTNQNSVVGQASCHRRAWAVWPSWALGAFARCWPAMASVGSWIRRSPGGWGRFVFLFWSVCRRLPISANFVSDDFRGAFLFGAAAPYPAAAASDLCRWRAWAWQSFSRPGCRCLFSARWRFCR